MAVPKRKLSRANTRTRRSQWKATPVPLTTPRCTARASRRGTSTTRPSGVRTGTRSTGVAFHRARRDRVRERDIFRLGTAISPACPSTAGSSC
jgi:large subunit ribosomal protein L32